MSACVILGSAFADHDTMGLLEVRTVPTPEGEVVLHRDRKTGGYVLFRHGRPHRFLPNQVPYRAHAWALRYVGCHALLVTSSVGVMDPSVELFQPHLLGDLLMLDNRLPDGSACSVFTEPGPDHGHLVLQDGLFHSALSAWLRERSALPERLLEFLYVQGPRTKSAAENRVARALGAQVNSMTLAPEVVLANELEIPTVGVVVGHKHSVPAGPRPDADDIAESLDRSQQAILDIVHTFLAEAPKLPFANELYRFKTPLEPA